MFVSHEFCSGLKLYKLLGVHFSAELSSCVNLAPTKKKKTNTKNFDCRDLNTHQFGSKYFTQNLNFVSGVRCAHIVYGSFLRDCSDGKAYQRCQPICCRNICYLIHLYKQNHILDVFRLIFIFHPVENMF